MVKFRNSGGGLSDNLQDRRAVGGKGLAAGGGVVGIVVVVLMQLLGGGGGGSGGVDITDIFGQIQSSAGGGSSGTVDPADEPLVQEMSDALDDIQSFWASDKGMGSDYTDATLVLFTDAVATGGCGNAPSSVGPFYCPVDETAYIDLSFFKELQGRFGAPGDFAQVYVLAHELVVEDHQPVVSVSIEEFPAGVGPLRFAATALRHLLPRAPDLGEGPHIDFVLAGLI